MFNLMYYYCYRLLCVHINTGMHVCCEDMWNIHFVRGCLDIHVVFCFHVNFEIFFSISVNNVLRILMWIAMNYTCFFKKINRFIFTCMSVFPACMSEHHLHALALDPLGWVFKSATLSISLTCWSQHLESLYLGHLITTSICWCFLPRLPKVLLYLRRYCSVLFFGKG